MAEHAKRKKHMERRYDKTVGHTISRNHHMLLFATLFDKGNILKVKRLQEKLSYRFGKGM